MSELSPLSGVELSWMIMSGKFITARHSSVAFLKITKEKPEPVKADSGSAEDGKRPTLSASRSSASRTRRSSEVRGGHFMRATARHRAGETDRPAYLKGGGAHVIRGRAMEIACCNSSSNLFDVWVWHETDMVRCPLRVRFGR
jgi:hypothetical protein